MFLLNDFTSKEYDVEQMVLGFWKEPDYPRCPSVWWKWGDTRLFCPPKRTNNCSTSLTVSIKGRVHVFCVKAGESPPQCPTAAKEPHLFSRSLSSSLSTALSQRSSRSGKPTRIKPSDTHCLKDERVANRFILGMREMEMDGGSERRGRRVGESDRLCARFKRSEPTSLDILMYTCSVSWCSHTHTLTRKPSLITDYAQQTAASGCVSVCLRKWM